MLEGGRNRRTFSSPCFLHFAAQNRTPPHPLFGSLIGLDWMDDGDRHSFTAFPPCVLVPLFHFAILCDICCILTFVCPFCMPYICIQHIWNSCLFGGHCSTCIYYGLYIVDLVVGHSVWGVAFTVGVTFRWNDIWHFHLFSSSQVWCLLLLY